MVKEARQQAPKIVVVHGETIAEPVAEGTNRAAVELSADMISPSPKHYLRGRPATLQKKRRRPRSYIRKGHSLSVGMLQRGIKFGVHLVINTDAHRPLI